MNCSRDRRPRLPDKAIEEPGQLHAASDAARQDNRLENVPQDDDGQYQANDSDQNIHLSNTKRKDRADVRDVAPAFPNSSQPCLGGALRRSRGFVAQKLERFLQLSIFGLGLGRDRLRRRAGLDVWLIRLRFVVIAGKVLNIGTVPILRSLHFNRRRKARMRSVLAQERLAAGRSPLDSRQQQSVTIAQREQLLLGAGAETLFADYIAALLFQEGGGDNLCCAGRSVIN